MLGKKSAFAEQCFAENFIGVDFRVVEDLSHKLPDEWRTFNKQLIPVFLAGHPDKSKISPGLACGALWTVAKPPWLLKLRSKRGPDALDEQGALQVFPAKRKTVRVLSRLLNSSDLFWTQWNPPRDLVPQTILIVYRKGPGNSRYRDHVGPLAG
jgi:hypothetical protein